MAKKKNAAKKQSVGNQNTKLDDNMDSSREIATANIERHFDEIVEIGEKSYASFEDQFVGKNSGKDNLTTSQMRDRYDRNRQTILKALAR